MKTRDLAKIGIPAGRCADAAKQILQDADAAKRNMAGVRDDLGRVAASPAAFLADPGYAGLAQLLLDHAAAGDRFVPRAVTCALPDLGRRPRGRRAVQQMKNACKLPVAVSGALMPDAHVGYGLPIGGVLATEGRRHPVRGRRRHRLPDEDDGAGPAGQRARRTSSAADARARARDAFRDRRRVQDAAPARRAWTPTGGSRPSPRRLKDRAWAQLGTSGSGNHFVEFGELTVFDDGGGLSPRRVPRAPQPLRQPRHRRADRAALQPAGA